MRLSFQTVTSPMPAQKRTLPPAARSLQMHLFRLKLRRTYHDPVVRENHPCPLSTWYTSRQVLDDVETSGPESIGRCIWLATTHEVSLGESCIHFTVQSVQGRRIPGTSKGPCCEMVRLAMS